MYRYRKIQCVSILIALLTIFIVLATVFSTALAEDRNIIFYMYFSYGCPHCKALKSFLYKEYGSEHVVLADIADNENFERLYQVCAVYYRLGKNLCGTPLTIVLKDGKVIAIVLGEVRNTKFWNNIICNKSSIILNTLEKMNMSIENVSYSEECIIPVFLGDELLGLVAVKNISIFSVAVAPQYFKRLGITAIPAPNEISKQISMTLNTEAKEVTPGITSPQPSPDVLYMFFLMIILALADSVNPCTLYIYTLLLIASALTASSFGGETKKLTRKAILRNGMAFISAVYVGYTAMGLGILLAFRTTSLNRFFSENEWILSVIAIAFGLWTIISTLMGKSRVIAKGFVYDFISRAANSSILSFVLGLILSFTLLPCSAGPYAVFLAKISGLTLILSLTFIVLYNMVFVIPLILILIVLTITLQIRRVQEFVVRHSKELSFIAGALLIFIGIYIAIT